MTQAETFPAGLSEGRADFHQEREKLGGDPDPVVADREPDAIGVSLSAQDDTADLTGGNGLDRVIDQVRHDPL